MQQFQYVHRPIGLLLMLLLLMGCSSFRSSRGQTSVGWAESHPTHKTSNPKENSKSTATNTDDTTGPVLVPESGEATSSTQSQVKQAPKTTWVPNKQTSEKPTNAKTKGISLESVRDRQIPLNRDNMATAPPNPQTNKQVEPSQAKAEIQPIDSKNEGPQLPEPKKTEPGILPPPVATNPPVIPPSSVVHQLSKVDSNTNCVTPTSGNGTPSTALPDNHLRNSPTASGCMLNVGPNETPSEKAVEIAQKLQVSELENKVLLNRMRKLEEELDKRDQALLEANKEIEQATAEVSRSRTELQTLRKQLMTLRERLRESEKEDVETLRAIILALEKLIEGSR